MAQASEILSIGDIPGGPVQSFCWGVSVNGLRAACTGVGPNGSEAFLWEYPGTITPLGDLSGGAVDSRARDISRDGTTIVGMSSSANYPSSGAGEPYIWTAATGMVGMGAPSGATWGIANKTNLNGSSIALRFEMAGGPIQGFAYKAPGPFVPMYSLPTLSELTGVDSGGDFFCGWRNNGTNLRAFLWNQSLGPLDIVLPAGYTSSRGNACEGGVVVGYCSTGTDFMAFRGQTFTAHTLGDLPGGAVGSNAKDIVGVNPEIIAGDSDGGGYNVFLYSSETGMISLVDALKAQNADITGWSSFTTCNSIDVIQIGNGLAVGGNGVYNGSPVGFVARLTAPLPLSYASSISVIVGELFGGTLQSLERSDGNSVSILCDDASPNGEIEFEAYCPLPAPIRMSVATLSRTVRNDCVVFMDLFRYSSNSWVNVGSASTGAAPSEYLTHNMSTGAGTFVNPSTHMYRARLRWVPTSDLSSFDGWTYDIDLVNWNSYNF